MPPRKYQITNICEKQQKCHGSCTGPFFGSRSQCDLACKYRIKHISTGRLLSSLTQSKEALRGYPFSPVLVITSPIRASLGRDVVERARRIGRTMPRPGRSKRRSLIPTSRIRTLGQPPASFASWRRAHSRSTPERARASASFRYRRAGEKLPARPIEPVAALVH